MVEKMLDLVVRDARTDDIEQIADLYRQMGQVPGRAINELKEVLTAMMAGENSGLIVCEIREGKVIGVLAFSRVQRPKLLGQALIIEDIFVAEHHRSQGVGAALMLSVLQNARYSRCVAVEIRLAPAIQARLRDYFVKLGFKAQSGEYMMLDLEK
jgi:N-acetylglutamate synthase-like GNAT family acetyltransferase